MANSGKFPVNPPDEEDGTTYTLEYELNFGKYFWPRWVRYPLVRLFHLEGTDGLTRWERKRLAKKYWEMVNTPPSAEARAAYRKIRKERRENAN